MKRFQGSQPWLGILFALCDILSMKTFASAIAKRGVILTVLVVCFSGCATVGQRDMTVTAYCGCGRCCDWERGRWLYLKLNFWNRYISKGVHQGRPYSGLTASGTKPREQAHGIISLDTGLHPWRLPFRILLPPWYLFSHSGTIAADTDFYPFGTEIFIPGYGWGVVEDRGGGIRGPQHIDVFFRSHKRALNWGRKRLRVEILSE